MMSSSVYVVRSPNDKVGDTSNGEADPTSHSAAWLYERQACRKPETTA